MYDQTDPSNGKLAVINQQPNELAFSQTQIDLLKRTILDEHTTDDELTLFSMICQRTGLNPFAKQIYGIRYKGKLSPITSIDGYRLIADRTGKYAGSDDPIFDDGLTLFHHLQSGQKHPLTVTVTVWKMCGGQRCPFTASASWMQYAQLDNFGKPKAMWAKMPHLMLSKCAEALALRKAFPAELSGLYTGEEMEQADNPPIQQQVEVLSPVPVKPIVRASPVAIAPPPKDQEWRKWRSLDDAFDWAVSYRGITRERAIEIYESIPPDINQSGQPVKKHKFEAEIKNLPDVF